MNSPALKLGTQSIVLVGMMGAGKSSLGKKLALALHLPFYDSDSEIEHAAQMSIADMFAVHGEAFFRDGERRVIARLLSSPPAIIAVGGGAFIHDDTRALIRQHALSVWLDVPLAQLIERVQRTPQKRPLLAGSPDTGDGDIGATMTRLAAMRAPAYGQADITIALDNTLMGKGGKQSLQKSVAHILQALEAYYQDTRQQPS